ncbi:MAG: M15 family metallopeptidase [Vallitalea sp.]|jgi:LAS superfamily LD-carboxypeptidase LdcB|nr:M15 family metallopeptidase [Vallitalea sp.]
MQKKISKMALLVGILSIVFIVSIGFKHKINVEANEQEKQIQATKINQSTQKENNIDNNVVEENQSPKVQELKVVKVLKPKDRYKLFIEGLLTDGNKIDLTNDNKLIISSDNKDLISISEDGYIEVSENAETGNKATITYTYDKVSVEVHIVIKKSLEDTVVEKNSKMVVTNYLDTDVVVNKKRNLPSNYIPGDLVKPNVPFSFKGENEKRYLRKVASDALEELFDEAYANDIKLFGVSGYRSYKRQEIIFNYKVKTRGFEAASRISAQPGQSEHQTGLAIDVSCEKLRFKLEEKLGDLEEGIWLRENAHRFGFIIRYPLGKEDITGYQYEPWHIRYVGKEIATDIHDMDLTFEEYLELR